MHTEYSAQSVLNFRMLFSESFGLKIMLYQHMPYCHPLHRHEHFTVRIRLWTEILQYHVRIFYHPVHVERKFRIG
jgi:hypothetical protein